MILAWLLFFYFLVNKRNKFYGVMMDQKIENGFRFKQDSI